MSALVEIAEAVAAALAGKRPVVALETTVVTHGLPAPEGVEAAIGCEEEVTSHRALPATIGVLDGRVRVGLSRADLERLSAEGSEKLNLSNLAAQLASRGLGSTTVAATAFIASRVGIEVFATGGIGGVHRGDRGDVSADLTALARYPVAVVCAGAKAVLDLPRTVEMLETLGIPILGYRTEEFPAFYRRSSGLPVDRRCDSARELAEAVRAHFTLGLGGVVIANPVPAEHEMPLERYEQALSMALAHAESPELRGRDVTPFLLDRMRELTGGASVFSNLALLRNNAALAAEVAGALAGGPG